MSFLRLRNWTSIIRYFRAERWALSAQGEIKTLFRLFTTDGCSIIRNIMFEYHDIHNSHRLLLKPLWCTAQHRNIKSLVSMLIKLLTIPTFESVSFVDFIEKNKNKNKSHNSKQIIIIAFEWMRIETVIFKWKWRCSKFVWNFVQNTQKRETGRGNKISFDNSPIQLVVRLDCRIECSLFDSLITLKWTVNMVCMCMAMCNVHSKSGWQQVHSLGLGEELVADNKQFNEPFSCYHQVEDREDRRQKTASPTSNDFVQITNEQVYLVAFTLIFCPGQKIITRMDATKANGDDDKRRRRRRL